MSNESASVGSSRDFDPDAIVEWIAKTADTEQVSTQTPADEPAQSPTDEPAQSSAEQSADRRGTSQQPEAGGSERPPIEAVAELTGLVRELQSTIEELSHHQQSPPDQQTDTDTTDSEFIWIETGFEEFSPATSRRQARTEETLTELFEVIAALQQRIGAVESTLDSEQSLSELEAAIRELRATQADLDQRLESELDSIERVLEQLVVATDELDERLDAVSDARQAALDPIRDRLAERDDLVALTQESLRHGVQSAVCGNCGLEIDIGLLEQPHCPGCTRQFTGIKNDSWLPFTSPTLQTVDRSP